MLTVAKITGHQSVENLIKHYDLSVEGQGLAEVVGALAQGPAVAKGQDHHSIVLQTRASNSQDFKCQPTPCSPHPSIPNCNSSNHTQCLHQS